MTGLDKIIAAILEEARAEAQSALDAARADAERILAGQKEESDALCERIAADGALQAAEIERGCASAARLSRRKGLLEAKQAILSETMEEAHTRLYAMPRDDYFGLLIQMAAAFADPGEGELLLNEKDLLRRPAGFESELNAALGEGRRLKISENARPLDGGFVLKYGDVEQNCSFRAIFAARADELMDRARGILFS